MTPMRFRLVPGTAPAASAPPKVMISSEGTGRHADSATMSTKMARYPYVAMKCCMGLFLPAGELPGVPAGGSGFGRPRLVRQELLSLGLDAFLDDTPPVRVALEHCLCGVLHLL